MAINPKILDKLNIDFPKPPLVAGPNVFTTAEYMEAIGLRPRQTRERLQRLEKKGKVQKVRAERNGKIVPAWNYIDGRKAAVK